METSVQTDRGGEDTIAVIDSLRSRIEEPEGMLKKQMDEHTAELAATRQNVLRETEDADCDGSQPSENHLLNAGEKIPSSPSTSMEFYKIVVLFLLGFLVGGIGMISIMTEAESCSSHFAGIKWEQTPSLPLEMYPLALVNGSIVRRSTYTPSFHPCHSALPLHTVSSPGRRLDFPDYYSSPQCDLCITDALINAMLPAFPRYDF